MKTTLAVGTQKGLFLFESYGDGFRLLGQHLAGWEVSSILLRPRAGTLDILTGTSHYAYGAVLRRSRDGGKTWEQPESRPAYAEGSTFKTTRIWQLSAPATSNGTLYAGIDEAGLFRSDDDAGTWTEVTSLTQHPTRRGWQPGAGGLCLHTIVQDHSNPSRMWLGISAAGVFRTVDGGQSWQNANAGLRPVPTGSDEPATVYCIHKIVQHPTQPDTLYMQFHGGVYASHDGGSTWLERESGLPSNFGFPIVVTRDGTLVLIPLETQEQRYFPGGTVGVYRSTDNATSWQLANAGMPTTPNFGSVLRDAMTGDGGQGVYFGTTSGELFASADAGASWTPIDVALPRVLCVRAVTTEG